VRLAQRREAGELSFITSVCSLASWRRRGSFCFTVYLVVIFVGLLVVLVFAVMLSAWCCKGIVFLSPSELLSFLTVSFVRQDRLKTPCVALAICVPAAEAWVSSINFFCSLTPTLSFNSLS